MPRSFEIEASESSGDSSNDDPSSRRRRRKHPKNRSSSPSIPSEDSSDRAFVARDSSQQSPDRSMQNFYRDSLMSQHPAAGEFAEGPRGPKWRNNLVKIGEGGVAGVGGGRGPGRRWMDTPPPGPPRSDDQWSMGSFVVGDDEELLYDEGASGEVEGTSEL